MTHELQRYCDGIHRRNLLKVGLAGLGGLSLPELIRLRAEEAGAEHNPPDRAVIFVEMRGGPTQHETYDPKPKAPKEFRGPLRKHSPKGWKCGRKGGHHAKGMGRIFRSFVEVGQRGGRLRR